ncbi:hypothetical protein ACA910_014471 [Epithemia clementina (nom. ined.)]
MRLSHYLLVGASWVGLFVACVNLFYSTNLTSSIIDVDSLDWLFDENSNKSSRRREQEGVKNAIGEGDGLDVYNSNHYRIGHTNHYKNATEEHGGHVVSNKYKNATEEFDSHEGFISNEYRRDRINHFYSWFEGDKNDPGKLLPNADKNGLVLDFAIAGFPKCGTTTVEANLGQIAPLPISDVCTPVHQTVYYAYHNWPRQFGNQSQNILRGTKCPAFIDGDWLLEWNKHLPRTRLIVGIRHPVLWFQSFWNMQAGNKLTGSAGNDPYKLTKPCDKAVGKGGCRNDCPGRQLFCTQRASFHLPLARLGKTLLTAEERQLLSAKTYPNRGGMNLENHNISNPIFVYELTELNSDYVWDEMAKYLQFPGRIPHDKYESSHGIHKEFELNFCDAIFDNLRAMMMPDSYDLSTWLQNYFIPLARDPNRRDVVIPNPDRFNELVEAYKFDPCKRLVRLENGTFVLGTNISITQ